MVEEKGEEKSEGGLFQYRKKIIVAKLVFGLGIGAVGVAAGFKYGYSRSAKKHGMSKKAASDHEDGVKLARKAFRKATMITVGCFAAGIATIALITGLTSREKLRNFSRRKWIKQREEEEAAAAKADLLELDTSFQNNVSPDDFSHVTTQSHVTSQSHVTTQSDVYQEETMVDKAEVLTDKWK